MFLTLLMAVPASAAELVEQFDRFEINWSTLRLRYYGEAGGMSQASPPQSFRELEQGAWQEGLTYASRNLPDFYQQRIHGNRQQAAAAADRVTRSTYSYNTIYFADGSVRVMLENLLPRTLGDAGANFSRTATPATDHLDRTGVIVRVKGASKPSAIYQLVGEGDGRVLFSIKDVAEEAFRQNLMGRWFRQDAKSQQLREVVGEGAIELAATFVDNGIFAVNPDEWQAAVSGYEELLQASRVALILAD